MTDQQEERIARDNYRAALGVYYRALVSKESDRIILNCKLNVCSTRRYLGSLLGQSNEQIDEILFNVLSTIQAEVA